MADYNSVYTGTEIDAAIAKTANMEGLVQVYNGAPTQVEIPASSLPINPGTGDRTGLYYVVHSFTADALTLAGTRSKVSMLMVKSVTSNASGTSAVFVEDGDTTMEIDYAGFHQSTSSFYAKKKNYNTANGTITEDIEFIHEIWRSQELV